MLSALKALLLSAILSLKSLLPAPDDLLNTVKSPNPGREIAKQILAPDIESHDDLSPL